MRFVGTEDSSCRTLRKTSSAALADPAGKLAVVRGE